MRKLILLLLLLVAMCACSGIFDNKKTSANEFVSVKQDLKMEVGTLFTESQKRIYVNEGLMYVTVIILDVKEDGQLFGKISSIDYNFIDDDNDDRHHKSFFRGTLSDDKIKVQFESDPPVVGANSNWTDDDWRIEIIDDVETILIPFYAKNHETFEWSLTDYEFSLTDKYSEFKWININKGDYE